MVFCAPPVPRETNLKFRQALTVTHHELTSPKKMASFQGKGMEGPCVCHTPLCWVQLDSGWGPTRLSVSPEPVPACGICASHGKGPLPSALHAHSSLLSQKDTHAGAVTVCCGLASRHQYLPVLLQQRYPLSQRRRHGSIISHHSPLALTQLCFSNPP